MIIVSKSVAPWDHPRSRGEYCGELEHEGCRYGSSPLSRGIRAKLKEGRRVRGIIPALAGNTSQAPMGEVVSRDHPRSRGEYSPRCLTKSTRNGSSPLSRGIPAQPVDGCRIPGIIPALAGNTGSTSMTRIMLWDHPRSRGEYSMNTALTLHATGSSPLSRGIHAFDAMRKSPEGIIPALAGNTQEARYTPMGRTDHPRSRGEYFLRFFGPINEPRIIPALAGNT